MKYLQSGVVMHFVVNSLGRCGTNQETLGVVPEEALLANLGAVLELVHRLDVEMEDDMGLSEWGDAVMCVKYLFQRVGGQATWTQALFEFFDMR